jgi:hypothetical protein
MKTPYCHCRARDRVINGRNPDRCYRCSLPLRPEDRPCDSAPRPVRRVTQDA